MFVPSRNRHALAQLAAISWNIGWPIVAGVAVGQWLDDKLGSSPMAALTLGLGAMATAIWRLIVLGRQDAIEREQEEHDPEKGTDER
jgi:F0F1-type ATP synthase assembly protein I